MIRVGWAKDDPLFRRVFTRIFIPAANEEQMRWFDDLQRMSTSPANAVASRLGRLAHGRGRRAAIDRHADPYCTRSAIRPRSFSEAVVLAGRIPDARLVELDSANHILLEGEPAWSTFVDEVRGFLEPDRGLFDPHRPPMIEAPSPRELDVIRLAAQGRTNAEIAADLGLSPRTVERHLSNLYAKMGGTGKAARAAAVAEAMRRGLA